MNYRNFMKILFAFALTLSGAAQKSLSMPNSPTTYLEVERGVLNNLCAAQKRVFSEGHQWLSDDLLRQIREQEAYIRKLEDEKDKG